MKHIVFLCLLLTLIISACGPEENQNVISNDFWKLEYDERGITQIVSTDDPYEASVIGNRIDADVRFRMNQGEWQSVFRRRKVDSEESMIRVTDYEPGMPFSLEQTFSLVEDALEWDIVIENRMYYQVDIGDVYVDFPMSYSSGREQVDLFEGGYLRHLFVSGDGSFLFFTKRSGKPPYLIITVKPGTHLEYYDNNSYFIHSGLSGNRQRGTWRQEHTYTELEPKGQGKDRITYGFRMQWADSYDELRDIIYKNGLMDIRVVPGMTLPCDLEAKFSLHTKAEIDSIIAEFPDQTELSYDGETEPNHHIYNVKFNRLGENMLTVYFDGSRKTYLEFFSTEPVETLLEKRCSFIVNNQQHLNPDLWYDGLFSIWDMKSSVLRGPDNTDGVFEGWYGYRVASDDPILGIPAFLASVNALYPDDNQIDALEHHIEHFVWGGLQRTDQEIYPYGIHGVPNWKVARDTMLRAKIENRRLNIIKIWRTFDYPHMIMLYYHMFQIADRYPNKVKYLDAEGYLERAWQTARAFFEYPYEIYPIYEIYKWGNYNEMLIPGLIQVLDERGRKEEADWLRQEWEKKAKYFIYDDPYPYASEFATDRTAFESTYAFAKYGATNDMKPDENLWYDKNEEIWYSHPEVTRQDALEFMERQLYASLSTRGWLEAQYYRLGSDVRDDARLSYMSRMGGWAVLDYGIQFADNPYDWLQHGYASYLSSFCLMNTGRPETNYGFWAPGPENDGALGQAFQPTKHERTWMGYEEDRGPWRYDSEQNLGMGAVTRMAATILADDPLFEWIAYGAGLEEDDDTFNLWPRDGVRIRFWLIDGDRRTGIELERDGFSREYPIVIDKNKDRIEFVIENRTGDMHTTGISLDVDEPGKWTLNLDGENIESEMKNGKAVFNLAVEKPEHKLILQKL